MLERINHRKAVAVSYKKDPVAKYAILRRENKQASSLAASQRNESFGFSCLHYSVSEASGSLKIKILNKTGRPGSVMVRTVDGDAHAGKDYEALDKRVTFAKGKTEEEIMVGIIDDDEWEPDEDFFLELYDANTSDRLPGEDTRTRVTILDDDKPGMIVFKEKKIIRHPANEAKCIVDISRIQGSDGTITCKYKTIPMGSGDQKAKEEIDYIPVEGTLKFEHNEREKEIEITIL